MVAIDERTDPVTSAAAPALGLRERKKQRTERELSEAAVRLVLERGFDHVTADDIAAAAEVSKTTFYRYFDSKEDACLGKSAEMQERLRDALDARPIDEPTLVAVRRAIMHFVSQYEHNRDEVLRKGTLIRQTPSLAARNLEHQAAMETVLSDFVATRLDGSSDGALRARIVAAVVMATLRATIDYWRETDGREELHDLMEQSLELLAEQRAAFDIAG
jgi:AcrR family transcriptional regulator